MAKQRESGLFGKLIAEALNVPEEQVDQALATMRDNMQPKSGKPITKEQLIASYGWNGSTCPNKFQRKAIAMSYGIYRQILHFFAMQRKDNDWDVYKSPTLTCDEQGGLIKIQEIK